MNIEEIAEAIKIIREPIVVNSDIYHTFDQENYDKLQRVYDNCQWFINNQEQIMQNAIDNKNKIDQLTNNWNELEDILKTKKARMLNEPDYSKYYLEGYETAIQTTHSSHSGIMLETAKNSIVVLCDELLDKMNEIKEGNNVSSRD